MKPTKQQKLNDLDETIRNRKAYLKTVESDIETITTAGNNQLFNIHGEIEGLEREKANLLRQNLEIEQKIRENRRLLESESL